MFGTKYLKTNRYQKTIKYKKWKDCKIFELKYANRNIAK